MPTISPPAYYPPTSYNARYTFSAKEKDEETGYSVTSLRSVSSLQFGNVRTSSHCPHLLRRFAARYYNSDLSVWLSVDPMSDKYPNMSPYVYCADNPVKLVDPDGEEIIDRVGGPPKKIQAVNEKNKDNISDISWGETSGVYPTKNVDNPTESEKYSPDQWDNKKTDELLKARAAIDLIGNKRNKDVRRTVPNIKNSLIKKLAAYHLKDNFPEVDKEIKDDPDVKFYYLSNEESIETPSINPKYWNQKCVKTYGPFYNIGGGDAKEGAVYIHFYKAIPKKRK